MLESPQMARNQIEVVKAKIDLVSVIGEYVDLKKAGRNFKGNCPFHSEKTPSFMISPELQMYKCFGCGVSGDVFTFLQEYEGLEFSEALQQLAEKAGVKLEKQEYSKDTKREKYIEINEITAKLYNYLLLKHPVGRSALTYLISKRSLTLDTIKAFGMGFSPYDSSLVETYLTKKKKLLAKDLETLGIVFMRGSRPIDRFKGRVIFPLKDHRGTLVGFSGRILPEYDSGKVGKYVNSPETPLYHKSHLLFGLDVTRSDIKRLKTALVVEGELDLLSVWQAGIKNIVAIKGSALTKEQTLLLKRYADTLLLALDADTAGDAASRRGIQIAEESGLEVKVIKLGDYKDPDEAVRGDSKEFRKRIGEAIPAWDFFIESALARYDISTGSGTSKASNELIPILSGIDDKIVQAHYISVVSQKLGVPVEAVAEEVVRFAKSHTGEKKNLSQQVPTTMGEDREFEGSAAREQRLLFVAFNEDPYSLLPEDIFILFQQPLHQKILKELMSYKENNSKFDVAKFSQSLPKEVQQGFNLLLLHDESVLGGFEFSEKEYTFLVTGLKINFIEQEISANNKKIRGSDSEESERLLKRNSELITEKGKLMSILPHN